MACFPCASRVPFILWPCSVFVGPILMASFEFLSFFTGLPEMVTCEVRVEMGPKSS